LKRKNHSAQLALSGKILLPGALIEFGVRESLFRDFTNFEMYRSLAELYDKPRFKPGRRRKDI
jgi:hypothetical protein